MKKAVYLALGMVFAISNMAIAFHITLGRDPFMDLMRLQELKRKEFVVNHTKVKEIQQEINALISSLRVKMVVSSKTNPSLKAALIVGPSGIPMVVVSGQKLKKGVYVKNITDNGLELSVDVGNNKETVLLKIAK